ncbi:metallophosphoesterase [Streptomyces sp. NPDC050485]|uniref:metallophosphoesterase n=1 Tax=Streptomyces sp. NPDC050485 TaxID=3365617 RepID=UPI0037975215
MPVLAHIGNLGLDGTPGPAGRVGRVVDYLRLLPRRPNALLVSGDITAHGDPAAYEEAAAVLDVPFPVLSCPGNHDVRDA